MSSPTADGWALMAEYATAEALVAAAQAAHDAGYRYAEAYAPFAVDGLAEALGFRRNRIPLVTLLGGIAGGVGGYLLQWYAAVRSYPEDVAGRPLHSWPMFIPVTFETAVLFAAFAAFFGAVGYALLRLTALGPIATVGIAGVAGLAGSYGAIAMIALWAVPAAAREVVDERFLLQGHFARVVSGIGAGAGATGMVTYELDGTEQRARARSLDERAVAAGTEVVIERIEDGVAFVEPWVAVESRL